MGFEDDADMDGFGASCDNCVAVSNLDQSSEDSDEDGTIDACDNCVEVFNPDQRNCDAERDAREVELGLPDAPPFGWQGDACDPDPCVEIRGREHVSDEVLGTSGAPGWERLERRTGTVVRLALRQWGGVPTPMGPGENWPVYDEDQWQGNMQLAHCACEPDPYELGECADRSHCFRDGDYRDSDDIVRWHDSRWDRERYSPPLVLEYGDEDDEITFVDFQRPYNDDEVMEAYRNSSLIGWRWTEEAGLDEGDHARLWLRPLEPDGSGDRPFGWDQGEGNTYSPELIPLEMEEESSCTIPDWFHHLEQVPPALELPLDLGRLAAAELPYERLFERPFSVPSLIIEAYAESTPFKESRYWLEGTDRSALSALAVRHQWTGSGFVSEYLGAEFHGGQLDLRGFAATVMVELPDNPNGEEDLNDLLSLWTFGGIDRQGQTYDELWRGQLDRGGQDPVYRFTRIDAGSGPAARTDGMLLADVAGQRLILLGGRQGSGFPEAIWTLDLDQLQWHKTSEAQPFEMGGLGVARVVTRAGAYFFGGRAGQGQSAALLRLDLETLTFETLDDGQQYGPGAREEASLAVDPYENVLYVYGGYKDGAWLNDLWAYHLDEWRWQELAPCCQAGANCPPPARGSALLASQESGTVTLALGEPVVGWQDSEQEWRFSRAGSSWFPERSVRNIRREQ